MRDSVGEEFCRTMAQLKRLYDAEPVRAFAFLTETYKPSCPDTGLCRS